MLPSIHQLRAPGRASATAPRAVLSLVLCAAGSAFAAPAPSTAPYRAAVRDVYQLLSLPPDSPAAPAPATAPAPALQRLAAHDGSARLLLLGTAAEAPAAPAAPAAAAAPAPSSAAPAASRPAAAPAAKKPVAPAAKAPAEQPLSFVSFGYDAEGRLIEVAQRADPTAAPSRRLSRRYGPDGLLGSLEVEEAGVVAYRLELSFEGGGGRARAILADPSGLALAAALVELGAGAAEGAPTRIAVLAESGEDTAVASFSYDAAGRLTRADFTRPVAAPAAAGAPTTGAAAAIGPAAAGPPDIALLLAPFPPGTGPAGAGPAALAPRAGGYAPPAAPRP
ncbi:MAG: hypothetical protein JNG85_00005, partial [Spirochaetaceae bacterium]|nr:hypothetical protein [Spirochaetaceae bacterium]